MADKKELILAAIRTYNMLGDDDPVDLPSETEYKFYAPRRWRMDLAYPDLKVAIEVHGGIFSNGRHTRGQGFMNDRYKMNTAQLDGWVVLEFPVPTIEADPHGCVREIIKAIKLQEKRALQKKRANRV